jgi:hypothetical protein
MTQPQPPLPPRDGPDERIDLLAPDGAPPPRERPVRPRELDAIPLLDPSESSQPKRGPTPAAPPPDRPGEAPPREAAGRPSTHAAGEPVETAVPCASCGYDLRGRPSAPRCPECGAEITEKARTAALPVDRAAARDEIFDGWQRLAGYSLVSVVLASPLVYILPLGVGVASCVGFASGFRLLAMRGLRHLPAPLHASLRDRIATWFWLERTQVAIAAAITVGGLISSVGGLGFLGNAVGPIYFFTLAAWWTIAMLSLIAQVRIGDRIAQGLVDPAILPLEVGPRLVRMLRWNLALGLLAALLATYSVVAIGGNLLPGADIAARSVILMLAATGFQIALAVRVHAHAVLVANCIFESDYFRPDPNRPRAAARSGADERNPNAVPPEKRHSFTPKREEPRINWTDSGE